ncbi:MAG TPA: hypothetical protein EYP34_15125 [Chromatiaceae bacterium]|nr:hypothetical protein [Chromatiaceae bacterium]
MRHDTVRPCKEICRGKHSACQLSKAGNTPTGAHPDLPDLGWSRFQDVIRNLSQPMYAFGGMQPEGMGDALAAGAQGIATKSYWP